MRGVSTLSPLKRLFFYSFIGTSETRALPDFRSRGNSSSLALCVTNGISRKASEILKNRPASLGVFSLLRKLKPMRQIEVAELLVTASN